MRKPEPNCPFLNKGEPICGKHFSLSGVGHVLKHCFAEYESCDAFSTLSCSRPEDPHARPNPESPEDAARVFPRPLVEVTIAPGLLQRLRSS